MSIKTVLDKIDDYLIELILARAIRDEQIIARTNYNEYLIYNRRKNRWILWNTSVMCEASYKFNKLPQWIQDKVNSDSYLRTLIK